MKGSLAIFETSARRWGNQRKIVQSPGLVGELAMIAPTEALGSIIAREPTTLLRVSRAVFHRVLGEYPRSAEAVRRMVSERLSSAFGTARAARLTAYQPRDDDRHRDMVGRPIPAARFLQDM